MSLPPEELFLGKTYQFSVVVEANGHRFASELHLSPQICLLRIRADITASWTHGFAWEDIPQLSCDCVGTTFLLLGLKIRSGRRSVLQYHPAPIEHTELEFSISKVLYSRGLLSSRSKFQSAMVNSAAIGRWVGATTVQDEIVERYERGTLFFQKESIPQEFDVPISPKESLAIGYSPSTFYSTTKFRSGLRFTPLMILGFASGKAPQNVIVRLEEAFVIFSFFVGHPIDVEKIRLNSSDRIAGDVWLYFSQQIDDLQGAPYSWFPLSKNIRPGQRELPEFPTSALTKYFQMEESDREYFIKYLRYRRRENVDERFLGFFRLLEKLCYQRETYLPETKLTQLLQRNTNRLARYFEDEKTVKKFLAQVSKSNASKLNTAGCIARFMKTLPNELVKQWRFKRSDLDTICKLRNDLTHANSIEFDESMILASAKFIEVLLSLKLLTMIGVSSSDALSIIPRMVGYHLIREVSDHGEYKKHDGRNK